MPTVPLGGGPPALKDSGATRIEVTVGSVGPPTDGSSVKTLTKLLPEMVPWFETVYGALPNGLLTVTCNVAVIVVPASIACR